MTNYQDVREMVARLEDALGRQETVKGRGIAIVDASDLRGVITALRKHWGQDERSQPNSPLVNLKQAVRRAAILRTEEVRLNAPDARAILKYLEAEQHKWSPPVINPPAEEVKS